MSDNQLGEQLYAEISKSHPELAGKLTGMVLQLGQDECRACLEDPNKLRGAVNEALALIDSAGGDTVIAKSPERRIDPEDAKARTFASLKKECQGKYTPKEIEEYWATMKPDLAAKPFPTILGNGKATEKTAKDSPVEAEEEAKDDVEAVVGLRIFLTELKLEKYYDAASKWAQDNGAANLKEIIENCEDFATGVNLSKLQKNRLEKGAESARDKACGEGSMARKANETVDPPNTAKVDAEEIAPPAVSAVATPASEAVDPPTTAKADAEEIAAPVVAAVAPPVSEDDKADGVEITVSIESVDDLKEVQSRLAEKMQNLGISQDQVADEPATVYVDASGKITSVNGPEDMEDLEIPGKMKFALKFKQESDAPSKGSKDKNSKGKRSKEKQRSKDVPEWCSFNERISPEMKSFQKPTDDQLTGMLDEDPKLNTTWCLWEQISQSSDKGAGFEGSLRKFASFGTVRKFWSFWNHLPQPSELLEKKKIIREDGGNKNIVDGLMIFRDGVKPAWEDPVNASGGHFQIQLTPDMGGGQIDEYWNNIVIGMVLDDIKPSEMITGVRLVDKLKGKRIDTAFIRIEVWFSDVENKDAVATLKRNFHLCLTDKLDGGRAASSGLKIDTKSHVTKK